MFMTNSKTNRNSLYRLPVRIRGKDSDGELRQEMSTTSNVSTNAATFLMEREVTVGSVLLLSLPLPRSWRKHSLDTPIYSTYAEVLFVEPSNGKYVVGVRFISSAKARELEGGQAKKERRREARVQIPVAMEVQKLDEVGCVISNEMSLTENVSPGGAMLMVFNSYDIGDTIRVTAFAEAFSSMAIIRGTSLGEDGINRINIEFCVNKFPINV